MRPIVLVDFNTGRVERRKVGHSARCGKQTYSSRKIAKQAAKWSTNQTGGLIEAYHCKPCHAYHIGHPPGSR